MKLGNISEARRRRSKGWRAPEVLGRPEEAVFEVPGQEWAKEQLTDAAAARLKETWIDQLAPLTGDALGDVLGERMLVVVQLDIFALDNFEKIQPADMARLWGIVQSYFSTKRTAMMNKPEQWGMIVFGAQRLFPDKREELRNYARPIIRDLWKVTHRPVPFRSGPELALQLLIDSEFPGHTEALEKYETSARQFTERLPKDITLDEARDLAAYLLLYPQERKRIGESVKVLTSSLAERYGPRRNFSASVGQIWASVLVNPHSRIDNGRVIFDPPATGQVAPTLPERQVM